MLLVSNIHKDYGLSIWDDDLNLIKKAMPGTIISGMTEKDGTIWAINYGKQRLIQFDKKGNVKAHTKQMPIGKAAHDITATEEHLVIANTDTDKVLFFKLSDLELDNEWSIGINKKNDHHINGVSYGKGRLIISCIELYKRKEGQRWRDADRRGNIIDLTPWYNGNGLPEVAFSCLEFPHTPKIEDNEIWYVESLAGYLCRRGIPAFKSKSFLRGYDFAEKNIYLGGSSVRQTQNIKGYEPRSKLFKLGPTYEIEKEVFIPEELGEIFEIIYIKEEQ